MELGLTLFAVRKCWQFLPWTVAVANCMALHRDTVCLLWYTYLNFYFQVISLVLMFVFKYVLHCFFDATTQRL